LEKAQKNNNAVFAGLTQKLPGFLKGIMGTCRFFSAFGVIDVALTVFFAMRGQLVWAVFFAFMAALIFVISNFWLSALVVNPILGLGETARRIAGGSYGTLAEKRADDEIGALTDAINDMSVRISASNKTQSEFISSVSHELRTPLTAITGWSETLLYDEAIQGDSRRGINIISKESGRLTNMVEELLEFSRIRDGRFTLNIETMDICAEVEDAVFTYEKLLRHEGMELVYDPPEEDIPAVAGDPRRLKQVIVNILDNAAKYGRGGNVEHFPLRRKAAL
jgi:signal transduction histidine kinase